MPFGITVTDNGFQWKLDQYFSHLKNIILIAQDIMAIGKKQNHTDPDLALPILLETARKSNVCLNYNKLQYKKTEVDFFGKTYTTSGWTPAQTKVSAITFMPEPSCKKQVELFIGMVKYLSKWGFQSLQRTCQR